jgi:TolA-binding protein
MTTRSMILAAAVAGLVAIGCEEKKTEVEKAVDKAATETKSAAGEMKDAAHGMAGEAKDAAAAMTDKAKEAGAAAVDKAKEMAPEATKAVEEIYNKAKAAIDSGKIEDAKPLIEQLKTYADKVPPEWKDKITALVTEYGKKAMSGAAGAIPGLPK